MKHLIIQKIFIFLFIIISAQMIYSQNTANVVEHEILINGIECGNIVTSIVYDSSNDQMIKRIKTEVEFDGVIQKSTSELYFKKGSTIFFPLKIEYRSEIISDQINQLKLTYHSLPDKNKKEIDAIDVKMSNNIVIEDGYLYSKLIKNDIFGKETISRDKIKYPHDLLFDLYSKEMTRIGTPTASYYDVDDNKLKVVNIKNVSDVIMYEGVKVYKFNFEVDGKDILLYLNTHGVMYYSKTIKDNNIIEMKLKEKK